MKSVMTHQFSRVPQADIQRSSFNRSHGLKTTFDASYLVPIFLDEALPGDTFNLRMQGFARLATPIKPIMDNMYMETFFFAVPNRLLWDNWVKLNGEQDNPEDSTEFTTPIVDHVTTIQSQSLEDYFGLPVGIAFAKYSALYSRAYNLIWNEWFRDQNLQDRVEVRKNDGPDSPTFYKLLKRGKRHDYFTSCLPWPQKGEAVNVPLAGIAPVVGESAGAAPTFQRAGGTATPLLTVSGTTDIETNINQATSSALQWADTQLVALISAGALDVNAIREGFQLQKMLERDARGGTRYTEVIQAHFGVTSPDARMQRPEYLGGGSSMVNINPIAQTQQTDPEGNTPQGNLAAIGTANLSSHGFTKSFTEHCVIIGLVNVRADLTYQQGLNRMFSRETRYDYYWPALAQIGEQAVLRKEIFATGNINNDNIVFGYQERYAEYRYKPSQITGKFRSTIAQPLDIWHLSQSFEDPPALNAEFIQEDVPLDRVIAVQDEPHFLFDAYFDLKCARPMPLYGVPGNMDRF